MSATQGAAAQASAEISRQSSSSEEASSTSGAGPARGESRPAAGKCPKCGAPIPASGECANCRAKELLVTADQKMSAASQMGVDVRKVDIIVHQARNSLDEGNFGDARAAADKALALLEETQSHFVKAREQIVEAGKLVEEHRAGEVDVGQAESLIQLAQSFLKTGNSEKAVAYAKKAIKTANEAQTRQVTEKALEGKPPLPPAVAKPVESGTVVDARGPAAPEKPLSRPMILAPAAEGSKAPKGPTACPSCGEPVEPGWKRCPSCTAPLEPTASGAEPAKARTAATSDAGAAAPRPEASPAQAARSPATPEAAPKAQTTEAEHAAAEKEIRDVESELERMEKSGQNVAHARNLLKLAISFLRGGSYEKATRYARKVKNVLDEKKGG